MSFVEIDVNKLPACTNGQELLRAFHDACEEAAAAGTEPAGETAHVAGSGTFADYLKLPPPANYKKQHQSCEQVKIAAKCINESGGTDDTRDD